MELFAGAPEDGSSSIFFNGAMSILQPYIDNGQLVIKSGQSTYDQVTTTNWDGAIARVRMDNILTANYPNENLDAILSPYDGITRSIIQSLKDTGYGNGEKKMPVITGQDCEVESIKLIIAGEQTSSIFKDTKELANKTAEMVDSILKGNAPEINDNTTFNNGIKVIPSFKVDPILVDQTNYKQILIDSGYYTESDLTGSK